MDANSNASVLVVAYHNLAVELEHLKRMTEALTYYNKAVAAAKKYLPANHPVG